jgi:hypothetical protein
MRNDDSRPPCIASTETDVLSLLSMKTTLGFLSYEQKPNSLNAYE